MGLFYGLCNVNPLMASRLIYYVPSWKKVYKSHSHNVGLCVFWMVCFLYNNSTPYLTNIIQCIVVQSDVDFNLKDINRVVCVFLGV